ncbi:MAG: biopolymer transporter ExbD [Verrucomicrobia bacterium]|nr:biopolymer transporter ExbD [Verrucomicrobiota bacterium]
MLRVQLDAAPFVAVLFLLVIFTMLGSVIYTPGARLELQLPRAEGLSGTDRPTVRVAIDADGRLYFLNRWIEEAALRSQLKKLVSNSSELPTLVVQADKSVSYEKLIRLALLARDTGISEVLLATSPGPLAHSKP